MASGRAFSPGTLPGTVCYVFGRFFTRLFAGLGSLAFGKGIATAPRMGVGFLTLFRNWRVTSSSLMRCDAMRCAGESALMERGISETEKAPV